METASQIVGVVGGIGGLIGITACIITLKNRRTSNPEQSRSNGLDPKLFSKRDR